MDDGADRVFDDVPLDRHAFGRVRFRNVDRATADDGAAIAALKATFGIEATMREGAVTFGVENGEAFVPRLFAELGISIKAVSVARPSLDDVFLTCTGMTIRDREASALEKAVSTRGRRRG